MALHHRLPRQGRRDAQEGDGSVMACSPAGAISAFTRVFDALWRHPGRTGSRAEPRISLSSIRATFRRRRRVEENMRISLFSLAIIAASGLASAAAAQVPPALSAPGESAVITLHAEGAQVYECRAGNDGKLAWAFREPVGRRG